MDRSLFTTTMIAAALLACAVSPSLRAGEPAPPSVTASLNIASTTWDGPAQAVIRFRIEPHWHLCWSNPGDAGLPPAIRWRMPSGFRAGPLQFPVPTKIAADGLLSYGYFNELILVTTITPPADYQQDPRDSIHAEIEWLVCRESCLPGGSTISLPCAGTGKDTDSSLRLLERFARTAPVPWRKTTQDTLFVSASPSDGGLALRFDPGIHVDDFYPELVGNAVVDHASIHVDAAGVALRVHPSGPQAVISRLRGILVVGTKAYTIDLPVRYAN